MAISYNGLWKQLIDHGMKKGDLCAKTGLSSSTIAKMTNCESVKLSVLEKMPLTHQCVHLCSPQHQSDRKDWIFIIIVV